jgi:hypothetical protein
MHLQPAPVRAEAMAYQMPDRAEWIVIARHPAMAMINVYQDLGWQYRQPLLTYCMEPPSGGLAAGFFNLIDQPTPERLMLSPGTTLTMAGPRKLGTGEITEDDYRVTMAITHLYS